jgi:hypothetical protein
MNPFSKNKGTHIEPPSKLGAEFLPSGEPFSLPADMASLDPVTKRQLTICNLFYHHHHQSVPDLIRVLDESYKRVITTLIENRLILDRRKETKTFSGPNRRFCPEATKHHTRSRLRT